MAGEDLCLGIGLLDVPKSSVDQGDVSHPECLEDPATFNPHCHLGLEVEWIWLNSGSEAIDMAFIDPSFADWALGRGR